MIVPKLVLVRAHEHWHDKFQQLTQDRFLFAAYSRSREDYDWTEDHYVRLGGRMVDGFISLSTWRQMLPVLQRSWML